MVRALMRVMSLHRRVHLWIGQACLCYGVRYADLSNRTQTSVFVGALSLLREQGARAARDFVFDRVERGISTSSTTWHALVAPPRGSGAFPAALELSPRAREGGGAARVAAGALSGPAKGCRG